MKPRGQAEKEPANHDPNAAVLDVNAPPSEQSELERRLRETGSEFIESHQQAETAIREAARSGMPPEAIAHVSGLSPETVGAFLRQLVNTL